MRCPRNLIPVIDAPIRFATACIGWASGIEDAYEWWDEHMENEACVVSGEITYRLLWPTVEECESLQDRLDIDVCEQMERVGVYVPDKIPVPMAYIEPADEV